MLHSQGLNEQQLIFSEESMLPENSPLPCQLKPSHNLSAVFDECHNYMYANEGLLKDTIFHEMVKLLVMKLHDERETSSGTLQFSVTSSEYRHILANAPSSFEKRMNDLFDTIRIQHGALFSDRTLKLKPATLAYVVSRMQYISLTETPGDIKGEAFQTFVYKHQRGDRGEFFTPHPIVKLAVEMIAPKPGERIIDPACGSGGFLLQTITYISRNHPNVDKASYIKKLVRGIEFNPTVALSAMIRLAFEEGDGTEITCANALVEKESLDHAFDVVLTNPPFGSKGKIDDQRILRSYLLARKWNKTSSNDWEATQHVVAGQSPDILFIEKCLNLLRPGGRMAIVLPDGLLQNISSNHVRYWIRSQAKVLGVVSIPQEAFVPYGTGIKTSLLLLQKLPSDASGTFMARIQKIGYDVRGQPIYKRDDHGRLIRTAFNYIIDDDTDEIASAYSHFRNGQLKTNSEKVYVVRKSSLNSRLDAEHYQPKDQHLLGHLKANGAIPLGEIADILNEADDFRLAADNEIRYIAISDVDYRTMQVVSQQIIKPYDAPSRATYRLCEGDIITATSGASTGTARQATALITKEEGGAICSNGFAVLRNIRGVEPLFLLAYMRTECYLRQVRRLMTGHAIPSISIEDLSKVLVPIPSKRTQKEIANSIAEIQVMRKKALKTGEEIVERTNALVNHLR